MDPLLFTLIAAGSSTAFLFSTEMGRDAVARVFSVEQRPVDRVVGADPDDAAAVRRLLAFRVVLPGGRRVLMLAPTREAAAQAVAEEGVVVEGLAFPHRVIRVPVEGRREWWLVALPRVLAFLGARAQAVSAGRSGSSR